jgi:CubicO group peptidase (beta-lactamase class C family)
MRTILMKITKWEIIFLVFGVFIIGCATSEPPQIIANVGEAETYFNKVVASGTPQGMSLVVVKDGKIVYKKGFGWADRPRKIEATSESIYHWWSITKIVTAIAILQLQEWGKLRLDDSVSKFLPYFNVQYPSANSKTITIRQLMSHSSGLHNPSFRIMSWIHHEEEPSVNQTDLVKKLLPDFSKLEFEPGDHSEYSNFGYMVLGAIIEKVTDQTYEAYIKEHILDPLGMKHTSFRYTEEMEPNIAAGSHPIFTWVTPLIPFIEGSFITRISGNHLWLDRFCTDPTASSGLIGSATDIARLVAAYLNGGELEGQRILSQESVDTMTNAGYMKAKEDDPMNYFRQGIGWQIYNYRGRFEITHDGGGLGFSTKIQLFPNEKLGFILFTNDVTCEPWKILNIANTLNW